MLCFYLCRALGNLETEEALSPLLDAAERDRSPEEVAVRLGALEGIAVLASTLGTTAIQQNERAMDVLLECSRTTDDGLPPPENGSPDFKPRSEVRVTAAFALGVVGGERATDRLAVMLDDPYPSARYNAATGLARQGESRAVPVLIEMLDPDNDLAAFNERSQRDNESGRITVIKNGIEAAAQLAKRSPDADLASLHRALERVANEGSANIKSASARSALQMQAKEALARVDKT
jgi:hypothetical protein